MHDDSVTRFLFEDLDIRGAVVSLSNVWQALRQGRDYAAQVNTLMGEMFSVAALIGCGMKGHGRLTIQMRGAGDLSLLVVDCEDQAHRLNLRGMAHCTADEGEATSVRDLLGDGELLFSLQSGLSDMPYQSRVPIVGDGVSGVFEHFLGQSAQQPARLWLFADEQHAAGLLLQTLPVTSREQSDEDGWGRIQHLASTLQPHELLLPATELLRRLFGSETLRVFDPYPVVHDCPRDEDRVRGMLSSMGREEVVEMLSERGEIIILDEIGNHEYRFGPDIVDELFPSAGQTLH